MSARIGDAIEPIRAPQTSEDLFLDAPLHGHGNLRRRGRQGAAMHKRTLILLIACTVLTWACDSPPPATRPLEGAPPPPPGADRGQSPMSDARAGAPTSAQQ